jgi:hypothetical protein
MHTCFEVLNVIHAYEGWNIGSCKIQTCRIYNIRIQRRNMEDKEYALCDAHFQGNLDSLCKILAKINK